MSIAATTEAIPEDTPHRCRYVSDPQWRMIRGLPLTGRYNRYPRHHKITGTFIGWVEVETCALCDRSRHVDEITRRTIRR